jgi:hypothetical protein
LVTRWVLFYAHIDEEEENMEDTDNNLEGEVETADEEEVA